MNKSEKLFSRRQVLQMAVGLSGLALTGGASLIFAKQMKRQLTSEPLLLEGFLEGTFIVRCRNNHDDQVDGITRNHDCEECDEQSVDGGTANVVCPDSHATHVGGITRDHLCTFPLPTGGVCGKQCRR